MYQMYQKMSELQYALSLETDFSTAQIGVLIQNGNIDVTKTDEGYTASVNNLNCRVLSLEELSKETEIPSGNIQRMMKSGAFPLEMYDNHFVVDDNTVQDIKSHYQEYWDLMIEKESIGYENPDALNLKSHYETKIEIPERDDDLPDEEQPDDLTEIEEGYYVHNSDGEKKIEEDALGNKYEIPKDDFLETEYKIDKFSKKDSDKYKLKYEGAIVKSLTILDEQRRAIVLTNSLQMGQYLSEMKDGKDALGRTIALSLENGLDITGISKDKLKLESENGEIDLSYKFEMKYDSLSENHIGTVIEDTDDKPVDLDDLSNDKGVTSVHKLEMDAGDSVGYEENDTPDNALNVHVPLSTSIGIEGGKGIANSLMFRAESKMMHSDSTLRSGYNAYRYSKMITGTFKYIDATASLYKESNKIREKIRDFDNEDFAQIKKIGAGKGKLSDKEIAMLKRGLQNGIRDNDLLRVKSFRRDYRDINYLSPDKVKKLRAKSIAKFGKEDPTSIVFSLLKDAQKCERLSATRKAAPKQISRGLSMIMRNAMKESDLVQGYYQLMPYIRACKGACRFVQKEARRLHNRFKKKPVENIPRVERKIEPQRPTRLERKAQKKAKIEEKRKATPKRKKAFERYKRLNPNSRLLSTYNKLNAPTTKNIKSKPAKGLYNLIKRLLAALLKLVITTVSSTSMALLPVLVPLVVVLLIVVFVVDAFTMLPNGTANSEIDDTKTVYQVQSEKLDEVEKKWEDAIAYDVQNSVSTGDYNVETHVYNGNQFTNIAELGKNKFSTAKLKEADLIKNDKGEVSAYTNNKEILAAATIYGHTLGYYEGKENEEKMIKFEEQLFSHSHAYKIVSSANNGTTNVDVYISIVGNENVNDVLPKKEIVFKNSILDIDNYYLKQYRKDHPLKKSAEPTNDDKRKEDGTDGNTSVDEEGGEEEQGEEQDPSVKDSSEKTDNKKVKEKLLAKKNTKKEETKKEEKKEEKEEKPKEKDFKKNLDSTTIDVDKSAFKTSMAGKRKEIAEKMYKYVAEQFETYGIYPSVCIAIAIREQGAHMTNGTTPKGFNYWGIGKKIYSSLEMGVRGFLDTTANGYYPKAAFQPDPYSQVMQMGAYNIERVVDGKNLYLEDIKCIIWSCDLTKYDERMFKEYGYKFDYKPRTVVGGSSGGSTWTPPEDEYADTWEGYRENDIGWYKSILENKTKGLYQIECPDVWVDLSDKLISSVNSQNNQYIEELKGDTKEVLQKICKANPASEQRWNLIKTGASIIGYAVYSQMGGRERAKFKLDKSLFDNCKQWTDCSGFVSWTYVTSGYKPPQLGFSTQNYSSYLSSNSVYRKISKKDLQIGDIGLSNIGGSLNHVGMYLGKYKGSEVWLHCTTRQTGVYAGRWCKCNKVWKNKSGYSGPMISLQTFNHFGRHKKFEKADKEFKKLYEKKEVVFDKEKIAWVKKPKATPKPTPKPTLKPMPKSTPNPNVTPHHIHRVMASSKEKHPFL